MPLIGITCIISYIMSITQILDVHIADFGYPESVDFGYVHVHTTYPSHLSDLSAALVQSCPWISIQYMRLVQHCDRTSGYMSVQPRCLVLCIVLPPLFQLLSTPRCITTVSRDPASGAYLSLRRSAPCFPDAMSSHTPVQTTIPVAQPLTSAPTSTNRSALPLTTTQPVSTATTSNSPSTPSSAPAVNPAPVVTLNGLSMVGGTLPDNSERSMRGCRAPTCRETAVKQCQRRYCASCCTALPLRDGERCSIHNGTTPQKVPKTPKKSKGAQSKTARAKRTSDEEDSFNNDDEDDPLDVHISYSRNLQREWQEQWVAEDLKALTDVNYRSIGRRLAATEHHYVPIFVWHKVCYSFFSTISVMLSRSLVLLTRTASLPNHWTSSCLGGPSSILAIYRLSQRKWSWQTIYTGVMTKAVVYGSRRTGSYVLIPGLLSTPELSTLPPAPIYPALLPSPPPRPQRKDVPLQTLRSTAPLAPPSSLVPAVLRPWVKLYLGQSISCSSSTSIVLISMCSGAGLFSTPSSFDAGLSAMYVFSSPLTFSSF